MLKWSFKKVELSTVFKILDDSLLAKSFNSFCFIINYLLVSLFINYISFYFYNHFFVRWKIKVIYFCIQKCFINTIPSFSINSMLKSNVLIISLIKSYLLIACICCMN